jgi:hypothetical protein
MLDGQVHSQTRVKKWLKTMLNLPHAHLFSLRTAAVDDFQFDPLQHLQIGFEIV